MSKWGDGPNAEAIEAWDTILFDKFSRFRWLLTRGLGAHGDAAIARLAPKPGERVIDLGCGFGDTTLDLARAVGPTGLAVGVDAARRFVEAASADAATNDVQNTRFEARDVQTDDLGGPYDGAFSRFGVMFFASPVAAMRNVRRALVPGGRLVAAVWRRREDNEWMYVAQQIVEAIVPPPETHDAPTCGPGPFSMAGADLVTDQMKKAGFTAITLERHDADLCIGRSIDEALAIALALGPAGETIRLAGDRAEEVRPRVESALRDAFARFERPDGTVWGPSSVWLLGARNPD